MNRVERRFRRALTPQGWIYLLVHVVVFLIGVILMTRKDAWQQAIGSGLVATGIAGWVLFLYVRTQETVSKRLDILARYGFVDAFEFRSISIRPQYESLLNDARRQIDILGFGLNSLRQDFRSEFPGWATKATVRVLLIDPKNPPLGTGHATERSREEGDPDDTISEQVQHFIDETTQLRQERPDRFQVRTYNTLPSVNIFRVDDQMFWGPYLVTKQSRNTPTFLIGRGILFDQLSDHFEQLWSDKFSDAV